MATKKKAAKENSKEKVSIIKRFCTKPSVNDQRVLYFYLYVKRRHFLLPFMFCCLVFTQHAPAFMCSLGVILLQQKNAHSFLGLYIDRFQIYLLFLHRRTTTFP
jgi:hypothetical protein